MSWSNTQRIVKTLGPPSMRAPPTAISRILPPGVAARSSTVTSAPRAARSIAAVRPPIPAPTTTTLLLRTRESFRPRQKKMTFYCPILLTLVDAGQGRRAPCAVECEDGAGRGETMKVQVEGSGAVIGPNAVLQLAAVLSERYGKPGCEGCSGGLASSIISPIRRRRWYRSARSCACTSRSRRAWDPSRPRRGGGSRPQDGRIHPRPPDPRSRAPPAAAPASRPRGAAAAGGHPTPRLDLRGLRPFRGPERKPSGGGAIRVLPVPHGPCRGAAAGLLRGDLRGAVRVARSPRGARAHPPGGRARDVAGRDPVVTIACQVDKTTKLSNSVDAQYRGRERWTPGRASKPPSRKPSGAPAPTRRRRPSRKHCATPSFPAGPGAPQALPRRRPRLRR